MIASIPAALEICDWTKFVSRRLVIIQCGSVWETVWIQSGPGWLDWTGDQVALWRSDCVNHCQIPQWSHMISICLELNNHFHGIPALDEVTFYCLFMSHSEEKTMIASEKHFYRIAPRLFCEHKKYLEKLPWLSRWFLCIIQVASPKPLPTLSPLPFLHICF